MKQIIFFALIIALSLPYNNLSYADEVFKKTNFSLPNAQTKITAIASIGSDVYIGTNSQGIYLCKTFYTAIPPIWTKTGDNITNDQIIEIFQAGSYVIAIGNNMIYRTTNKGDQWERISYFSSKQETINCITYNAQGKLFIGTKYAVYSSADFGKTWVKITSSLGNLNIKSLMINSQNHIFFSAFTTKTLLYRTTNSGSTWLDLSKGIETTTAITALSSYGTANFAAINKSIIRFNPTTYSWERFAWGFDSDILKIIFSKNGHMPVTDGNYLRLYNKGFNTWLPKTDDFMVDDILKYIAFNSKEQLFIASEQYLYFSQATIDEMIFRDMDYNVTLVDELNQPLATKNITFYRNNQPIDNYTTSNIGTIAIRARPGDTLKFETVIEFKKGTKPDHEGLLGNTMYTKKLDNAKFDGAGKQSFFNVKYDINPTIVMNHTVYYYNLLVSVEWDAKRVYLDSLGMWFRYLSNYLYDVSDGQLCLDIVHIYDNKQKWDGSDIAIYASNQTWPTSGVDGIRGGDSYFVQEVHLPRKWFGNLDANRTYTARSDWLAKYNAHFYTTIGHELGHYIMGFYDEYENDELFQNEVFPDYNFGFMDDSYPSDTDPWVSEMSSVLRYPSSSYKVTDQWGERGMDCWNWFKNMFASPVSEKPYCPIYLPSDRFNAGLGYLSGPNEDVGKNLIVQIFDRSAGAGDFNATVTSNNSPLKNAKVYLNKSSREIYQGKTSDLGQIKVLGANIGDVVKVYTQVLKMSILKASYTIRTLSLNKKDEDDISLEDTSIVLTPIDGYYTLVNSLNFTSDGKSEMKSISSKDYTKAPDIEFPSSDSTIERKEMTYDMSNGTYSYTFDNNFTNRGIVSILANDNSGEQFFVPSLYNITKFSDKIIGPEGDVSLHLDSSNSTIEKIAIMSTDFPTFTNDQSEFLIQIGKVYSISSFPLVANFSGKNLMQIGYSDFELSPFMEQSIAIFKWNENIFDWEFAGGWVDTLRNFVHGNIDAPGIYTLFTVNDITGYPKQREDYSNSLVVYPNPVMNKATITFNIPIPSDVTLTIYNTLGEVINIIDNQYKEVGRYNVEISAKILPQGIYFCRLTAGKYTGTTKFIIIK